MTKLVRKYKGPVKLMLGFSPRLLMADAKSVEFILSSRTILKKSTEYKFLHPWLGSGLLTSDGIKWKKHRRLLTSAFHFQILKRFIDVFDTQSNILIKKLEEVEDKKINIFPYMKLHALDVICEATMNTSINAQLNPNSNYVKSVEHMCRIVAERTLTLKMWNIFYVFTKDFHIEQKALGFLHGLSNSVIKSRRKELETKCFNGETNKYDSGTKHKAAFLDILLTSTVDGVSLNFEEIRNEVDTFMFAGHDTTTSALSFALYCLSKHQELQEKVFEEIVEIVGNRERASLTYENLQQLKYMEQFLKEVFRMYPPVPAYARILTADAAYDGKVIPKGVQFTVLTYQLHHNPDLFPEPEVFDPERFNAQNSRNISLYSYVPFSAGLRNCIGQKFAMLEIKTTICRILLKFKILPVLDHNPVLIANAVLTSKNGLPIRLQKRN
ncbi:hypothetical protein FQR65_LT03784 [Abscondita terminalis]|nr:hypothetical protein FQR65_LT03784 [Abscondita terminalis]